MTNKREIRVLVAFSKTFYFLDRGRQRGISYDLLKEFEKYVNISEIEKLENNIHF